MAELIAAGARLVRGTDGATIATADLRAAVGACACALDRLPPGAVLTRAGSSVGAVVRLLGAFAAGRPVLPADPRLTGPDLAGLAERLGLVAVLGLDDDGAAAGPDPPPAGFVPRLDAVLGACWLRRGTVDVSPHPDLALLLTTSGSTGTAKAVRLSRAAVETNAASIAEALALDGDEVAPTSLPLHYSYGLSVLTSHLRAGAAVAPCATGVLSAGFWRAVDRCGATSLAGVPHTYDMLERIHWRPSRHPTLRVLTQAGGPMAPAVVSVFADAVAQVGGRMYVMYGQTEACARISVLPPGRLADRVGSVGRAIPGGELTIDTGSGTDVHPAGTGEIVYRGPNVMLGYAADADDLGRGDDLGGTLRTGDLGRLDDEGFLWVTGRIRRISKVFGVRVSLDDVELALRDLGPTAAVADGDRVRVWSAGGASAGEIAARLAREFRLHPSGFVVRTVDQLPHLASGKVDYRSLETSA